MAFDVTTFRQNFPDFASTTTYPDAMLNYWGSIATIAHSYEMFREMYDHILSLYVAHKATLQAKNIEGSAGNKIPNQYAGAINNVNIDGVSVGYGGNVTSINKTTASAGEFAETMYGRMYWDVLNMYCAIGQQA